MTHFSTTTNFDALKKGIQEAVQFHKNGDLSKAKQAYQKLLRLFPNNFVVHHFSGIFYSQQKDFQKALTYLLKAIELQSDNEMCFISLGQVYHRLGNLMESKKAFQQALTLNPDNRETVEELQTLDKIEKAIACKSIGEFNHSMTLLNEALVANPSLFQAHCERGEVFILQGDLKKAAYAFKQAIEINSNHALPYARLAAIFNQCYDFNRSITLLEHASKLPFSALNVPSQYAFSLQAACDWKNLDQVHAQVHQLNLKLINEGKSAVQTPFSAMVTVPNSEYNFAIARSISKNISQAMQPFIKRHRRKTSSKRSTGKIRIGYLSTAFNNRPNAFLLVNLFEKYDRDVFEVFAFSLAKDDGGLYRKRIKAGCDRFVDLQHCSYRESAEIIEKNEIDILIELNGHIFGNGLSICALRPAPVQAHYLGYPGTLGTSFIDYFIADKIVLPKAHRKYFQEKIIYLPFSYQMNDANPEISEKSFDRKMFDLPDDAIVFCCFNNSYKITQQTFTAWMRILQAVPRSVLWLRDLSQEVITNLKKQAVCHNVEANRLIFSEDLPRDEHLVRLKLADLMLDTFICNAHTTASDALRVGVPLITLQGTHFASRVASSLLTAIGLPELITQDVEAYISLGTKLATHPKHLKALKQKLARNQSTQPLFNLDTTLKYLEKAYLVIWERYLSGKKPTQIQLGL